MALKKVRLDLARNPDFPEGSRDHGYEFVAPLTDDGHLDPEEWLQNPDACVVRRFWAGEEDEHGRLVRLGPDRWVFDYDPTSDDDDEPTFRFDRHSFVPGEYVSITEHDGVERTFRVVSVVPLD